MADGERLTFDVNVKVEECDDEQVNNEREDNSGACGESQSIGNDKITIINLDDSDEYDTSVKSKSMDVFKCDQGGNIEDVPAPSNEVECETNYTPSSENDKKYYLFRRGVQYTLTREIILKGIEEQSKLLVNKSDLLIYGAIKKYYPEKSEIRKTFHEELINAALEQWKKWQDGSSMMNNTPLLYKCYLCNIGWWRLYPFKEHITKHKNPNLQVSPEFVNHECNLVATIGVPNKIKSVTVHTNCWRCNKSARHHVIALKSVTEYKCERCQVLQPTCDKFAQHQSTCKASLNIALNSIYGRPTFHGKLCTICCLYCPSQLALDNHMNVSHAPRSDEPANTSPKTCNLCLNICHELQYHDCPKKLKLYKCHNCFNRFTSKSLQHLHMAMSKGLATCPDCNKKFKQCYILEHMLNHSANFDMCQYCIKCANNILYVADKRYKNHMISHGTAVAQRLRWGAKMLLPLKCIKGQVVESTERFYIPDSEMYKRIDELEMMGKSPSEIAYVIKRDRRLSRINEIELIEMDDSEKPENYAFQIQLDAEIQRDIEIEEEISKVFKASNCYQKFLEKETNEPIEDDYDDDVYMMVKQEEVLVLSDSDDNVTSEMNKPEVNANNKCVEKENSDSDIENFECVFQVQPNSNSDEDYNSVKVKVEPCDIDTNNIKSEINTDVNDVIKQEAVPITQDPQTNIQGIDLKMISENITSSVEIEDERDSNDIKKEIESDKEDLIDISREQIDFITDIKLEHNYVSDVEVKNDIPSPENANEEFNDTYDWNVNSVDINQPGTSGGKQQPIRRNTKNKHNLSPSPLLDDNRYDNITCNKCGYNGPYQKYIEHVAAKCPTREINCTYCTQGFDNITMYLKHLPEHDFRYLWCPSCNKNFNMDSLFVDHMVKHICELFMDISDESKKDTEPKVYVCKTCEELVDNEKFFEHWELHLGLNEGNVKAEESMEDIEESSLMSPRMMKLALGILVAKPLKLKKCIVCEKSCTRKNDAQRHLIEHLLHEARIKTKTGVLECPICYRGIEKTIDWRQHMRDHARLKIYRCNLCLKRFSDSSNYSKHRKVHNEFSYICDQCGGKFRARNSIIRHLVIHEKNPVSCDYCNKTFYSESCLKKHLRVKHTPHTFICTVCRKRFSTLKAKWDHMWEIHKQRKQAADCPICNKEYRRIIDVRYHMKIEHEIDRNDVNYKTLKYRDIQNDDVT